MCDRTLARVFQSTQVSAEKVLKQAPMKFSSTNRMYIFFNINQLNKDDSGERNLFRLDWVIKLLEYILVK